MPGTRPTPIKLSLEAARYSCSRGAHAPVSLATNIHAALGHVAGAPPGAGEGVAKAGVHTPVRSRQPGWGRRPRLDGRWRSKCWAETRVLAEAGAGPGPTEQVKRCGLLRGVCCPRGASHAGWLSCSGRERGAGLRAVLSDERAPERPPFAGPSPSRTGDAVRCPSPPGNSVSLARSVLGPCSRAELWAKGR